MTYPCLLLPSFGTCPVLSVTYFLSCSQPPRKLRTTRQSSAISNSPNKISVSVGVEIPNKSNYSDIIGSEVQGSVYKDVSTGFTTVVSQPLAPIGTPAGSSGSQADKQFHTAKYVCSSY